MKKYVLIVAVLLASCSKKKDPAPEFSIEGKQYDARWKTNSQGRQEYVHISFASGGDATLWTSVEKILKYGNETLSWSKSGENFKINGTLKENYYKPAGTVIFWGISPTKGSGSIKSTFNFEGLNFIEQ